MPGKSKPRLTRKQALAAKPLKSPVVSAEPIEKGGKRLTIQLHRTGWEKWVAGAGHVERKFELDSFGIEVYDACDGKTSVDEIIRRFATTHNLSAAEAELSVTQFLEMLMKRGLTAMSIEAQEKKNS